VFGSATFFLQAILKFYIFLSSTFSRGGFLQFFSPAFYLCKGSAKIDQKNHLSFTGIAYKPRFVVAICWLYELYNILSLAF